jgi:hypothetical protein
MVDVGRRFELAGRAASAGRFDLAEYEAGELEECFESDVPGAQMPKEGSTQQIPALAKSFADSVAPALRRAAAARDRDGFALAFEDASAACNACHRASARGFIEVPAEIGKAVPVVEPMGEGPHQPTSPIPSVALPPRPEPRPASPG